MSVKPRTGHVTLRLTPRQARVIWQLVEGQADAGACAGGNTPQETRALQALSMKLLAQRDKWKASRP